MKYLSKYMFLIIGALVMSLVLWFIFIGKNVTFSNYTEKGAAFEQMWYLAETPVDCFVRDDLSGASDEADAKPVSLRHFMQDYWVVNSGFHIRQPLAVMLLKKILVHSVLFGQLIHQQYEGVLICQNLWLLFLRY